MSRTTMHPHLAPGGCTDLVCEVLEVDRPVSRHGDDLAEPQRFRTGEHLGEAVQERLVEVTGMASA